MLAALRVCPKCRTEYDPPNTRCSFDGAYLIEPEAAESEDTPSFGTPQVSSTLGELGAYRLLSILGEGSMAVVYAAEHNKLNRRCAIKRLRPEHLVDKEMVQRFLAEARTIASIQHPNLVTIYDVVEEPNEAYLVMELLDGRDLQTVLQTGSLEVDRAIRIGIEICEALSPVHARGIVHRDIKPANIFLCIIGGREQVKMLDFGAARLLGKQAMAAERRLQAEGATLGSPMYMSPEQISGESLDPRSDIYSIGVVLYEMVVGGPPFLGETFSDVMLQHLHHAPKSLIERGAAVSSDVDRTVLRCLEKKPDRRPQSTADLARELRKLVAPLEGAHSQSSSSNNNNGLRPWVMAVGAVAAIAAIAAVGLVLRTRGFSTATAATNVPTNPVVVPAHVEPTPPTTPAINPGQTNDPLAPARGPEGTRLVKLESAPPGATVEPVGGGPGCTTPCALWLPSATSYINVKKQGFRDDKISVGPLETMVRLALVAGSNRDNGKPNRPANDRPRPDRPKQNQEISHGETVNPFEKKE